MLVCGIDIGTTNLKVALFDDNAKIVWLKTEQTPRIRDEFGYATDAAALVDKIEDLLIEGWKAVGKGKPISAISSAGVGEDGLYLDAELQPLGLAIPWFDQRAAKESKELALMPVATPRSGIQLDPTRTAAKWLWISRHNSEVLKSAKHWVSLTDFPLVKWSRNPFIADTLASRTSCFDSRTGEWIDGMLNAASAKGLPRVVCAGTVVGNCVSNRLLQSGAATSTTKLVAGGHDHPVAAHAIHRLNPFAKVDSLGTANVIYGDAPSFAVTAYDPYIAFMASIEGKSKIACLGVFEFSSTVTAHKGGMESIRKVLDLPQIPGTPEKLISLNDASERQLLEWATMNSKALIERLSSYGVPDGPIFATGGWSRSNALLELRASIFGEPIFAPDEKELTVLGAALFALASVGGAQTFETEIRMIEPNKQWKNVYEDMYSGFAIGV